MCILYVYIYEVKKPQINAQATWRHCPSLWCERTSHLGVGWSTRSAVHDWIWTRFLLSIILGYGAVNSSRIFYY